MRISHTGAPPSVLGRVVAILEAFGPDTPSLTLAQLSARTRLPKATAHRLAGDLAARGLLERTDGRFRLGRRLFELGELVQVRSDLRQVALPFMHDLADATGEAVQLAVLDGTGVVVLETVAGAGGGPANSAAGFPPHDVLGRVLRARGAVGTDRAEGRPEVAAVASPVLGPGGDVVAALAVTGPTGRFDPDRLGPAVRTAALALSRQLARGFRDVRRTGPHAS